MLNTNYVYLWCERSNNLLHQLIDRLQKLTGIDVLENYDPLLMMNAYQDF